MPGEWQHLPTNGGRDWSSLPSWSNIFKDCCELGIPSVAQGKKNPQEKEIHIAYVEEAFPPARANVCLSRRFSEGLVGDCHAQFLRGQHSLLDSPAFAWSWSSCKFSLIPGEYRALFPASAHEAEALGGKWWTWWRFLYPSWRRGSPVSNGPRVCANDGTALLYLSSLASQLRISEMSQESLLPRAAIRHIKEHDRSRFCISRTFNRELARMSTRIR